MLRRAADRGLALVSDRKIAAREVAPAAAPAIAPTVAPTIAPTIAPTVAPNIAQSVPAAPATDRPPRRRLITTSRLSFILASLLLIFGWTAHTERYITPARGAGYALGIVGGSLMLVLLAYSLRKRWKRLELLGSTPSWFRFHMVLGIAGPLCILYHSNFGTGATNSNVALFSMLAVAGSGVVGRYINAHIDFQGYERLSSLWQSLHIPLIFVMVIAAIVHVIAVNVY